MWYYCISFSHSISEFVPLKSKVKTNKNLSKYWSAILPLFWSLQILWSNNTLWVQGDGVQCFLALWKICELTWLSGQSDLAWNNNNNVINTSYVKEISNPSKCSTSRTHMALHELRHCTYSRCECNVEYIVRCKIQTQFLHALLEEWHKGTVTGVKIPISSTTVNFSTTVYNCIQLFICRK